MGDKSKIEWTDATWNPVRGCSLVSDGCRNCYAMHQAHRLKSYRGLTRMTEHGPVWTGEVQLVPKALDLALRWKKPKRIFVNSMSDLFHENIPDSFIESVFGIMAWCYNKHIFQILTKRPERMLEWFKTQSNYVDQERYTRHFNLAELHVAGGVKVGSSTSAWPLPNVWLGVSVEDQKTADERIPILLQTPAAIRWISAEPLLGSINLHGPAFTALAGIGERSVDWVVVGGESGPHARPMHPHWVRAIRDQCQFAGVPFFFKQWGEWIGFDDFRGRKFTLAQDYTVHSWPDGRCSYRVGKKAAGAMLDGREWREYPEVKK